MTNSAQPTIANIPLPFKSMDLAKAFSAQPPKLDYVLSGLIVGSIGLLIAPGGVGKSTFQSHNQPGGRGRPRKEGELWL